LLSTCPDSQIRDGLKALALAQKFQFEGYETTKLRLLALANGELGDFAKAIELQERVVTGEGAEHMDIDRLQEFRAHRPVRMEAPIV